MRVYESRKSDGARVLVFDTDDAKLEVPLFPSDWRDVPTSILDHLIDGGVGDEHPGGPT